MKTILISTDFSDAGRNAAHYGIELAKATKSEIILFHAYHIPAPPTEAPIIMTYEDLEEDNNKRLETEKMLLDPKGELSIKCISLAGFAVDNIIEIENEYKPSLIIMGMQGAGKLSEFLLGSTSTSLINRTATPVIIIPEKAAFKIPKKITFACDYDIDPTADVLEPLKSLAKTFDSEILIFNLLKQKDAVDGEKAKNGMLVENYLKDVAHTYYFEEDDNFIHGTLHFMEEHATDIVAIVPHKHSFIHNLFKESHTKQLAFHSKVPLLTIPDRSKTR